MATTKLILTHDVERLGSAGDVVEVKSGYARNYLVPRGFATKWTKGAQAQMNQTIDRRRVIITDPIKTTGDHTVTVNLHADVRANLKVRVLAVK